MKPNPNIIRLLDIIENGDYCYIVTELYKGGTLKDYIADKRKFVIIKEIWPNKKPLKY